MFVIGLVYSIHPSVIILTVSYLLAQHWSFSAPLGIFLGIPVLLIPTVSFEGFNSTVLSQK